MSRFGNVKQSRIPWIGPLAESLLVCLPFLGIINFVFISITLYASVRPYLESSAPWLTFWMFMLTLVIITLFSMFLIWKFVLSPLWKFRGEQMFEQEIRNKLNDIQKSLNDIKKGEHDAE